LVITACKIVSAEAIPATLINANAATHVESIRDMVQLLCSTSGVDEIPQ
jgi:hypothetical protein